LESNIWLTTKQVKFKKTWVTQFNNLILFTALDSRLPIRAYCRATEPYNLKPILAGFFKSYPCRAFLPYRPVERRGEESPLARYPDPADRYPDPAERYQSFDNRPLAPERSPPKKTEKKAVKIKAAAPYATDFAYDRADRFESRPQPPQPQQQQLQPQQQQQVVPVEAPVYAPEPKKQKKVAERNAQAGFEQRYLKI
jgi:hypothetical protein